MGLRKRLMLSSMVVVALAARSAFAAAILSNGPSPLAVCQDTIREASERLSVETRRRFSACVTRGIECLLSDGVETCCARAAERCANDLARLDSAREQFQSRILKRRCADVSFADVLSSDGLAFGRVTAACARLTPPIVVADLTSLVECLEALTTEDVVHLIATGEIPRAAEALACMGLEGAFPGASGADPAICEGGSPRPTPTATATVPRTATPLATRTATPAVSTPTVAPATATAVIATTTATAAPTTTTVATAVATTTRTATPQPTATAALTATRTATPGSTATRTATAIATATSTPTAAAPTSTPVSTSTRTATAGPTATRTSTPIPTATGTATFVPVATSTPTRTATPTPTATPIVMATPGCGNGVKEAAEDCDDGNNFNCDACPANCQTEVPACATDTTRFVQQVRLTPPDGVMLTGAQLCLEYPNAAVSLPGSGQVSGRLSGLSLSTLNDFDNAALISFVGDPQSPVQFSISFDHCLSGGSPVPPPPLTAFTCVMRQASDEFSQLIEPPSLVDCTAVAP